MEKNRLFYGDNIDVLRKYIGTETIDLCYIDPPFNSKKNYNQIYNNIGKEDTAQAQAFVDTWTWNEAANDGFIDIIENTNGVFTNQIVNLIVGFDKVLGKGSLYAYLMSMTLRIAEIYRVLKPTGSFYLHCDPTSSHYLKLILDAIFCVQGGDYQNEIVWEKTRVPKAQSKHFAKQQDVIFFYTKKENYTFNYQYVLPDENYTKKYFSQTEEETGRRYQLVSFLQDGQGQARMFGDRKISPPKGKHWIWSQEKIDEAMENNWLIFTHPDKPRLKKYLDAQVGKNLGTIWTDIPPINSQAKERLGYPTQKPEALLERIIRASTNKNDIILDCYCGCGTTISVAERLKRKWIGIDITYQSISLIMKRLEDTFGKSILENVILSGIPEDFESAVALANKKDDRVRKEFEKWAVLTFSNNRAIINEKKGGDGGIDGIAYILDYNEKQEQETKNVIFSVKSSKTLTPSVIRDLFGTIERENAAVGYLITLFPMDNLVKESTKYGVYQNTMFNHSYQRIEVISINDILQGKRMNLPSIKVLKSAERKAKEHLTKNMFEDD